MKERFAAGAFVLFVFVFGVAFGQEDVTVVAPTSEAADGLDLHAVSEMFKDAESVEAFEKALNDPDAGVNNLDLDDNGEVDYIRVVEQVADETHVIILQVPLGEDEFQDVATIEVEKAGEEGYNMQVHGDEVIYGPDYYVAPTHIHIHTWPIIRWIYRPHYRPYRSGFYFGYYPPWWRPFRPVSVHVYRTRTVRYTSRATFSVTRTSRVRTVTRVNYKPRSSPLVKKKTRTVHKGAGGKTTVVKKSVTKTHNPKTGKTTTVKKGVKKTHNPRTGKTTVKKGSKKTTRKKGGKKTTVKKGHKKTRTRR